MAERILTTLARHAYDSLADEDPTLYNLLETEYRRQLDVLTMVASSSITIPSVLACEGMTTCNVTTEGYPGARFHAGCQVVDEIENLAIQRAKKAFQAQYANVQPHSASIANHLLISSLLNPGDTILGMALDAGGHLTHGAKVSISGQYFNSVGYYVNNEGLIDYDEVASLAYQHKPSLIICGTTAYPRVIEFHKFRRIADEIGAFLLADITHIAGLVAGGEHPSPIEHAHFTTTCTHKQLYGPKGGLILMGRDAHSLCPNGKDSLSEMVQKAVFPFFQGSPCINTISAKARAFSFVMRPEFKRLAQLIKANARAMASRFIQRGFEVISGGSDNHIVLINVYTKYGITGYIAERALEECRIIVNKNKIQGDAKNAYVTSGIRLGTNILTVRNMKTSDMVLCADLIEQVLSSVRPVNDRDYEFDLYTRDVVCARVDELCKAFPIPSYPRPLLNSPLPT